MVRTARPAFGAAALMLASVSGAAAQDFAARWLAASGATGEWGGRRAALAKAGITPELNFTTDLLANPVGGERQSAAYAGLWSAAATFDLDTLAGINGLSLYMAAAWAQGSDLSDDIGNVFGVAEVFNGDTVRLGEFFLEGDYFAQRLSFAVGRLATGSDFAVIDSYGAYVNSAVNGNPAGILLNVPSFTTPPFAAWGARMALRPRYDTTLTLGLYDANPADQNEDRHGIDFSFDPGKGLLFVAEAKVTPNSADDAPGLPGTYAVGAYLDTSSYSFVADASRKRSGNYGVYAIAEQMVFRESPGSSEGLTLWGTVTLNPDQDINTLPVGLFGGAVYEGLLPGRPNDVSAFGVSYGAFSDTLTGQNFELAFEVNHRFQLGNWFYVTPDVQYIVNPGGEDIADALVAGVEVSINF